MNDGTFRLWSEVLDLGRISGMYPPDPLPVDNSSSTTIKRRPSSKSKIKPNELVPIRLRITDSDIEEMEYWINECPIGDPAAHNGIAIALQRLLKPGIDVRVSLDGDQAHARIDHYLCDLGSEAIDWMNAYLMGRIPEPVVWQIWLPRHFIATL